jgi:hypothetical protein
MPITRSAICTLYLKSNILALIFLKKYIGKNMIFTNAASFEPTSLCLQREAMDHAAVSRQVKTVVSLREEHQVSTFSVKEF